MLVETKGLPILYTLEGVSEDASSLPCSSHSIPLWGTLSFVGQGRLYPTSAHNNQKSPAAQIALTASSIVFV